MKRKVLEKYVSDIDGLFAKIKEMENLLGKLAWHGFLRIRTENAVWDGEKW